MVNLFALLATAAAPSSGLDAPLPAPETTASTIGLAAPAAEPAPGFVLAANQADAERKWTGSVGFTASIASGNTDEKTLGATGQVEGKAEKDRWTGQLLWNYADKKGEGVTQRRTYGQAKYDYFLTEKSYVFGVLSGESDYSAALDLRLTVGGGYGYQFRDDKEWKISGEGGLSYVDENYEGSADDEGYLAARLAYKVDTTISEKWTAGQWGELFPSLEDMDDVSARVDTHARVTLSEKMFAQLQHIYTWDNTPATGADRVDQLLLIALGWSF